MLASVDNAPQDGHASLMQVPIQYKQSYHAILMHSLHNERNPGCLWPIFRTVLNPEGMTVASARTRKADRLEVTQGT